MFFNQGDATIKIETQEQELRGLRTRVQELEILLVEQQDTLDRLIADAMGELGIFIYLLPFGETPQGRPRRHHFHTGYRIL